MRGEVSTKKVEGRYLVRDFPQETPIQTGDFMTSPFVGLEMYRCLIFELIRYKGFLFHYKIFYRFYILNVFISVT